MKENKKMYSFRFDRHRNAQLSQLASFFKMDRTSMLEYMIDVWAQMWVNESTDKDTPIDNGKE